MYRKVASEAVGNTLNFIDEGSHGFGAAFGPCREKEYGDTIPIASAIGLSDIAIGVVSTF